MAVPTFYRSRNAYHFTSIENLESIIDNGIFSTNQKIAHNIQHVNVAEEGIQRRRAQMQVPGSNGRCVHDYVPFYFAKKTPMLLAVLNKKNIDQQFIIYFSVPVLLLETRPGAYFTDASANTANPPNFFSGKDQSDQLDKLDWQTIDSNRWKYDDNQKHRKMAELLLPDHVPLHEVNQIVTWNPSMSECVRKIFQNKGVCAPNVTERGGSHYYCEPGKWNSSLVTGPFFLKRNFDKAVSYVNSFQRQKMPIFKSLDDALRAIRVNFAAIRELKDIDGLNANYGCHWEDVGAHSRRVADLVLNSSEYSQLDPIHREVLELAAYLHDIGKGPKTRWRNSCMDKADHNHPNKSLPMLKRILTEDLPDLPPDIVRKIIMLVTYDDLLGDIVVKGRNKSQLFEIIICPEDITMLVALSKADIGAIDRDWLMRVSGGIEALRVEALENLQSSL